MDKWTALTALYRAGNTLAEKELLASQRWLIRFRWVAGVSVLIATWAAHTLLGLGLASGPLYLIGAGILAYNAVFSRWEAWLSQRSPGSLPGTYRLALLQITADWVAMTFLIHFSGGVESPAILYFFFHIVLAAILLSVRATYLFAGLGALLLNGTVWLEYAGILPHVAVAGLMPAPLHQQPAYVGGIAFFFTSTMFVITYLATGTTGRLRKRESEVVELGLRLQHAYSRLQTLYNSTQAISATLDLQHVLDQLAQETAKGLGVQACSIQLLDKNGTQLYLAGGYGLRPAYVQKGPLVLEHNPLAREVLAGQTVVINDTTRDERLQYPREAAAEGIRSMLTAPLHGKSGPLGLIRVYASRPNRFDEDDKTFLEAIASQGSIAIENALAYQAIQNLDEAKSKFVRTATHELRSPVSVVRSLLRTLAKGYAGSLAEPQRDLIERVLRRADFLQALIDDLLDLAAGKAELQEAEKVEPVNLAEVMEAVVERYKPMAAEKRIQLAYRCELPTPPLLLASLGGVDRIFNNLLSNAIKYTPEGGRVTVTIGCGRDSQHMQVQVSDTGIGIPQESLPHLFEEFYRAPNARQQIREGTGLGLSISRDLVQRYGGRIDVESDEGQGTTFTIAFPL